MKVLIIPAILYLFVASMPIVAIKLIGAQGIDFKGVLVLVLFSNFVAGFMSAIAGGIIHEIVNKPR